jgi:hypothetical protein
VGAGGGVEDKRIAALPDGEQEKDVEACYGSRENCRARDIQEARSVAARAHERAARTDTSSAYMMRPDTPADSALPWLSLVTSVTRAGTCLLIARVNPDELMGLERAAFRETKRRVRWCQWNQEWREVGRKGDEY